MTTSSNKFTFEFPEMQPYKRLRELILHIAKASAFNQKFSKTKLVKLLYFADFTSYRLSGEPVTGSKYVKLPNGPMPKELNSVLAEMVSAGEIKIEEEQIPGYTNPRMRVIALRNPDYTLFSAKDIARVDELIRLHWDDDGTRLAEMTHGVIWKVLGVSEEIPYESALISDEEITQENIADAQELIKKHGWG